MTQAEQVIMPAPYMIDPATITEAYVITVANQKGGSGKTTVSMNLAGALANRGYNVLVVDADPQNSAVLWAGNNQSEEGFPAAVVNLAKSSNIHKEVTRHAKERHFIIIDCPPAADSPVSVRVMPISDLVLVPVLPSPIDMWATTALKIAIDQAQSVNPDLQARIVMNNCQMNTNLTQQVVGVIEGIGIPRLSTLIRQRVVFKEMAAAGNSIYHYKGAAHNAVAEIEAMTNEVLQTLNTAQSL